MINVDQIRAQAHAVLDRKLDLDAFDEWLATQSWNMHRESAPEAIRMVGKLEMLLADFDEERISAEELLRKMWGVVSIVEFSAEVNTGQSNDDSAFKMYEWSAASDKQPSVGFSYILHPQP